MPGNLKRAASLPLFCLCRGTKRKQYSFDSAAEGRFSTQRQFRPTSTSTTMMKLIGLLLSCCTALVVLDTILAGSTNQEVECEVDGTCNTVNNIKSTKSATTLSNGSHSLNDDDDTSSCGLYAAESAIPNSGLGMYTARTIKKGDRIFSGELVIQVEDPDLNEKLRRWHYKLNKDRKKSKWLLASYYWNPTNTLGEYEADDVQSIIPGLGMLANSHTGLWNADIQLPQLTGDLHRYTDPGAGAVTNFHDLHFTAKNGDIEMGSELYVEYGDSWFDDRNDLGMIPLSYDFQGADKLIKSMWDIQELRENPKLANQVLDLVLETAALRPRLQNALPKTTESFEKVLESGSASLTVPDRVRSIEWLETNGRCLDNIRPGVSTIRQAGRGAFATRPIQKGQVVAPMPLTHLERKHMDVYGADDIEDPNTNIWLEGKQLFLNYVYGHPKSSLLFFPYAPVVNYINHNASQANVMLRWSTLPNHKSEWLSRSAKDVSYESHAGLIMELVATKDIQRDDEIFLNYGSDWETAWKNFVKEWKPIEDDRDYVSAAELNARNEYILTSDEIENEENPLYNTDDAPVFTACYVSDAEASIAKELPKIAWKNSTDRFVCHVTERDYNDTENSSSVTYTVIVHHEGRELIVEGIPRTAIRFVDSNYKSDATLRNTFRHEIQLPDEMVPQSWRDL